LGGVIFKIFALNFMNKKKVNYALYLPQCIESDELFPINGPNTVSNSASKLQFWALKPHIVVL